MQLGLRTLGMLIGLVGTCLAFAINLLYSSAHVLGRVFGITSDTGHLFWGLLMVIIALAGSLVGLISAPFGSILLVVAAIGLFFVAGWWALFASPFLILAAVVMFAGRREPSRTTTTTTAAR
jgi:hypothetical protein